MAKRLSSSRLRKSIAAAEELGQPSRYPMNLDPDLEEEVLFSEGCIGIRAMDMALTYFPEWGNRLLPPEGDWIMTVEEVHVQGIDLPLFNAYFAVPYRDGVQGWKDRRYSATVMTEQGEVRLWPHEYGVITADPLTKAWSDGEVEFHPFGSITLNELSDRMFYAMAKGISGPEAAVMALGDIRAPIGYFTMKAAA